MVDLAELERLVDERTAPMPHSCSRTPRTIGVFESDIAKIAAILHAKGALLYMDGANMNALVGKTRPGDFGVDVMHLNLHKTFSTPHGGGGPGSGPVACKKHCWSPSCPSRWSSPDAAGKALAQLTIALSPSAASACSTAISACSSARSRTCSPTVRNGLRQTTEDAVLNANYIRAKLEGTFELPYKTRTNCMKSFSATSCRPKTASSTGDMGKRLIDYGFHAYTTSFPMIVAGSMMIEPTESESREELDLFIDAMKQIAREAAENPTLVSTAPHTTRIQRLDETGAARKPVLRWKGPAEEGLESAAPAKEW